MAASNHQVKIHPFLVRIFPTTYYIDFISTVCRLKKNKNNERGFDKSLSTTAGLL
jgi:hypothetical protein